MITTVTLNATTDIVIPVDEFKRNKVLHTPFIFSYPGGKGTNTARALSAFGVKTAAAGFCGTASIKDMNVFMIKYGIKPLFTGVSGSNRICALINEFGHASETVINSGSVYKITASAKSGFISGIKRLAKISKAVSFSGSLPKGVNNSFYSTALKAIRKDTITVLDTSGEALKKGITGRPHILKINKNEFEHAFRIKLKDKKTVKRALKNFSAKTGINSVIITLAKQGSIAFSDSFFFKVHPVAGSLSRGRKTSLRDTGSPVGSGDAYTAGLLYGIEKGLSVIECLRRASAAAAANLSHTGSCFIDKSEVEKLYKKTRIVKY